MHPSAKMSMLSRGHPWKYDHACPWSSRLNPTNVWAWYIGHACMLWSMIFENLPNSLFSVTMLVQVRRDPLPKFSFYFFEYFQNKVKFANQIGRARGAIVDHLACDFPPLCQIWGHLKICMKFENLNLELFWNLDAPICQNIYVHVITRPPMKYEHAFPWSSRSNATIII